MKRTTSELYRAGLADDDEEQSDNTVLPERLAIDLLSTLWYIGTIHVV